MPSPNDPAPGRPIRFDIGCAHCGYNLKTLPRNGVCPECGRSVEDTLRPDLFEGRPAELVSLDFVLRVRSTVLAALVLTVAVVSIAWATTASVGFMSAIACCVAPTLLITDLVVVLHIGSLLRRPRLPSSRGVVTAVEFAAMIIVLMIGVIDLADPRGGAIFAGMLAVPVWFWLRLVHRVRLVANDVPGSALAYQAKYTQWACWAALASLPTPSLAGKIAPSGALSTTAAWLVHAGPIALALSAAAVLQIVLMRGLLRNLQLSRELAARLAEPLTGEDPAQAPP